MTAPMPITRETLAEAIYRAMTLQAQGDFMAPYVGSLDADGLSLVTIDGYVDLLALSDAVLKELQL